MMTSIEPERRSKETIERLEKLIKFGPLLSVILWVSTAIFIAIGFNFQSPANKFLALETRMNRHDVTDSLVYAALIKLNLKLDNSNRLLCLVATPRDVNLSGIKCNVEEP